jgi:hypothetical protein
MKSLFTAFAIFLMAVTTTLAEMTNGAFYVDKNVECHLVAQNGLETTNQLLAGYTYTVGDQIMEMYITTPTMFCFAGGPIVQAGSNSTLIINLFEHQVNNRHVSPRKANIGPFNLTLGFNRGEFIVVYTKADTTSTFGVLTPHTGDPYMPGKYVFVVDDNETTVNVLDKETVFWDKKTPPPRRNPVKSRTKTVTVTKPLDQKEIDKYNAVIADMEKKASEIVFIIINCDVEGVLLK